MDQFPKALVNNTLLLNLISYIFDDLYREGRTRGYAFIYVKNVEDVEKVVSQLQGKRIMSREVQAKKYEASERPAGGFRDRSPRGGYNDRN